MNRQTPGDCKANRKRAELPGEGEVKEEWAAKTGREIHGSERSAEIHSSERQTGMVQKDGTE